MRILVTGAKGQLGYDVLRELSSRNYLDVWGIDKDELDITDSVAVEQLITKYNPDVIMHNAAWTAVDKAEECPEMCKKVNVVGTNPNSSNVIDIFSKACLPSIFRYLLISWHFKCNIMWCSDDVFSYIFSFHFISVLF